VSSGRIPGETDPEMVERIARRVRYLEGFADGADAKRWGKRQNASAPNFGDFQLGYLVGQRAFEKARDEIDDKLIAEHKAKKAKGAES
jgi:hypothetical protein